MEENEWTTLAIRYTTKDDLDKRKVHPKQSYDEVIQQLLKDTEEPNPKEDTP